MAPDSVREVRVHVELLQLVPRGVPGPGLGLAEDGAGQPGALDRLVLDLPPLALKGHIVQDLGPLPALEAGVVLDAPLLFRADLEIWFFF